MANESLVEELKRYVRFGPADERVLVALAPHITPYFEAIADRFYERIAEHEGAHAVILGEAQMNRLHHSLVAWMQRLFQVPHDEAYFEHTRKIGRIHVQIGLPQHYMISAMSLLRLEFSAIIDETLGANARPTRDTLHRLLDMELAVMLESYSDSFLTRLQQKETLEHEEVSDALKRTEHRYVNAVELVHLMMIGLDRDGLIRLFNREAERVTGFGREEVLGKPFFNLMPEPLRDEHEALLRSYLAKRAMPTPLADLESALRTSSGKVRDVGMQLAYAQGNDKDVVLFLLGRDKTEDHEKETRMRQNDKLAAVGMLAAGFAHEIRNPLNGAQLHVTFLERALRKKGADAELLDATHVVGEEIKRLSALVTEFLDFARPKPLELSPTSIRRTCERISRQIAAAAQKAAIQVDLDLPQTDIVLELDTAKIDQLLQNLLQNAIEALEPIGGGTITLRVYRKPRHLVIEVEDDGPGLPSPDAPIFDPFYSTKPNGTGLGLAIAHRIATDHSGSIDVESAEKKTLFRVMLPIKLSTYQSEADLGINHQ